MWPYPRVIAHRGAGSLAPENTLAAMRRGRELGYAAVEFDVMLTRDHVPVVVHDVRLGRTVMGRGRVCELDAAVLLGLDAGSWFSPAYAKEHVPRFDEVLAYCCSHGIWMNVEIKPAPGFEALTGAVVAARLDEFLRQGGSWRERHATVAPPLLSSFSMEALAAARQAAPDVARACLFERLPPDWLAQVRRLDAVAVHLQHRWLNAAQAAAIRAAGLGLFCYTVNDAARARTLLGWGVDAFCTDRLDLIGPDFASLAARASHERRTR